MQSVTPKCFARQSATGTVSSMPLVPRPGTGRRDGAAREAEQRLRLVGDVRRRTRRAVLVPTSLVLALGLWLAVTSLARHRWPHVAVVSAVALVGLVAFRPLVHWTARRRQQRRGVVLPPEVRLRRAAIVVAALGAALATGADVLVTTVAAAVAGAAYLCGLPVAAVAALVDGAVVDGLLAEGEPHWAVLAGFGTVLAAIGGSTALVEHRRS
jgi:hypothetical protein